MAMAAPNQPLPGLHVTAPDEDMEISDYERNADDIDIDIDLTVDPSHHEDENMDDDRSEHDNRDDVMLDGDGNDDEDGMMQDNMSVPDEHLTDASDVGYVDIEVKEAPQDQDVADQVDVEVQDSGQAEDYIDYDDAVETQTQTAPEITPQHNVPPAAEDQNQISHIEEIGQQPSVPTQSSESVAVAQTPVQDQVSAPVEGQIQADKPPANSEAQASDDIVSGADQSAQEQQNVEATAEPQPEPTSTQSVGDSEAISVPADGAHSPSQAPEASGQDEVIANEGHQADVATGTTELSEQPEGSEQVAERPEEPFDFSQLPFDPSHGEDNQSPPSGPSLHPVVVVYQGDEISLFPPDESKTTDSFYFLQDESLAHQSIKNLLQACRQVLGDTMRDEDELEIDIAELGLCVSEDSEHATNTSFAQILDVYLQLHQLDGHHNPAPLYMTLNTKTRFSARLQSLLAAIADGRGLSQLSFLEDMTEEEAYVGSELAPEEQGSAGQMGEQEGTQGTMHEQVKEHGVSQTENPHDVSHRIGEHEHESDPTERQYEGAYSTQSEEQSSVQQLAEASASAKEDAAHEYVSPPPEELPEYGSSEEGDARGEQYNVRNVDGESQTDAAAHEDSHDNDQIDYDDGENADDAKDDASYRSSTLQGDNTPAVLGDATPRRDSVSGVPTDEVGGNSTSIAGLPRDERIDPSAEGLSGAADGGQHHDGEIAGRFTGEPTEEHAPVSNAEPPAVVEHGSEFADQQEVDNADEALEQELERELNNQGESFDLPEDYPEVLDGDHYSANFEGGEDYGYEQREDGQETHGGETNDGFVVVVETEDAQESVDVANGNQPSYYQDESHDDGFEDAEAKQTTDKDLDGTHSAVGENLQDDIGDQAQPNAHASEEDDLDTIDYDDEEPSQPQSPQQDEAAVQSPSSAKRAWEELGQDDDQDNEQVPKKVKSE